MHPDDREVERYTPRMYVDYYARCRGIEVAQIGVAPTVLLSWGQAVVQRWADRLGAERAAHWFYNEGHIEYALFSTMIGGAPVSLVQCPEGAPATVMMMEELIACGATTFLALGWAGSLQPNVTIGNMVIPVDCISDEGTSRHYQLSEGATNSYRPDAGLAAGLAATTVARGIQVIQSVQWTTDAPYRELTRVISSLSARGVVGVDMETAAMYALGHFRRVKVCNLLVISDEVWAEWRPAFRSSIVLDATLLAEEVLIQYVEESLGHSRPANPLSDVGGL